MPKTGRINVAYLEHHHVLADRVLWGTFWRQFHELEAIAARVLD